MQRTVDHSLLALPVDLDPHEHRFNALIRPHEVVRGTAPRRWELIPGDRVRRHIVHDPAPLSREDHHRDRDRPHQERSHR